MRLLYMRRWCGWMAACALLALFSGGPAGATPIGSLGIQQVEASQTTSSSQSRGYRFRAEADLRVTGLALYDVGLDGLGIEGFYRLHLWTDAGASLATAILSHGSGAPLLDGFRLVEVQPVLLLAGQVYRLSADFGEGAGGPELLLKPTLVLTHSAITLLANVGSAAAGLDDFGLRGPNGAFPAFADHPTVGPNLVFTVVPEPGTGVLLALGLLALGWRRR